MTLYDTINIIYDIMYDTVFHPTMQVLFVNEAIRKTQHGLPLHGLAPIVDPSDEIIEVLLAALRWDMQQRRFGLTAEGLEKLHALSVELHIPVKATCSICSPWKPICPPLHKTRVMVVRNPSLWLVLVLTRKVKLVLVSWVSGTQHCRPYMQGN